jgi:predicted Zn-dependent protease
MKIRALPLQPALWVGIAFLAAACASAPPEKPISVSAEIQFHKSVGHELAYQLEPRLPLRQETTVTNYLEAVAQKIADSTKDFLMPNISIALIREVPNKAWADYALPGGRIYLSIGMLKQMGYQNEVAAEIAIQLAHLRNEDLLDYFKSKQLKAAAALAQSSSRHVLRPSELDPIPEKIDYFGPKGAFAFDEKDNIEAVETAVDLLYSAGYDPRGLVFFWQVQLNPASHSPYDKELLKKMLEETRRKIAQKAPLRNPIVKPESFISIRKRIEKL